MSSTRLNGAPCAMPPGTVEANRRAGYLYQFMSGDISGRIRSDREEIEKGQLLCRNHLISGQVPTADYVLIDLVTRGKAHLGAG